MDCKSLLHARDLRISYRCLATLLLSCHPGKRRNQPQYLKSRLLVMGFCHCIASLLLCCDDMKDSSISFSYYFVIKWIMRECHWNNTWSDFLNAKTSIWTLQDSRGSNQLLIASITYQKELKVKIILNSEIPYKNMRMRRTRPCLLTKWLTFLHGQAQSPKPDITRGHGGLTQCLRSEALAGIRRIAMTFTRLRLIVLLQRIGLDRMPL